VLGDPLVWDLGDEIVLDLHADAVGTALPALERYVLADDVTFEDGRDAYARLTFVGPKAPDAVAALGVPQQGPGRHDTLQVAGAACRVLRLDREGAAAYEWLLPADGVDAVCRLLEEVLPLAPVGPAAFDAWRVAHRVPAWGAELGPDVMPLEARLGDVAVSFTKGCYPGQEPVAKAHHVGRPPNLLVRLALEDVVDAASGLAILDGARKVGRLTTVAEPTRTAALGYVRQGLAREGRALAVEGGGRARVRDA
jgi:folate-binding protein YgfZ